MEDYFDFQRGQVPGTLEIQADSEKNRRKFQEKEVFVKNGPECCPAGNAKG